MDKSLEKNNFDHKKRIKYFAWTLFSLSVISIIFFIILVSSLDKNTQYKTKNTNNYLENVDIKAKSFFVLDVKNDKELFSKNKELALPLASLTKIITVITANGEMDKSKKIEIKEEYLTPEGDSALVPGDVWDAESLMDFTLLTSSNDGAYALAKEVSKQNQYTIQDFIKKMNEMAKKIGMKNSYFSNVHGLDDDTEKSGAYGSAEDIATMFDYMLKENPQRLEATHYDKMALKSSANVYDAVNTNIFVDKIPSILGSKTGYTDLAGGNLAIAFDAGMNRPIIIAVLGSTQEDRFKDTLKLAEATLKKIQK